MTTRLTIARSPQTKAWLRAGYFLVVGVIVSTFFLLSYPQHYLAISDSLSWRLGMPSVGQTRLERTLRAIHLRGDSLIGGRSILLLGDSHLHSFPTSLLGEPAVNYSVAGETAERLAERVTHYKSLGRVKQVVLLTGRNDLAQRRSPKAIAISVDRVLRQIPTTTPVAIVGIPPLRTEGAALSTRETNRLLSGLCKGRMRCLFIDTEVLADASGSLRADFSMADGVHLTSAGYTQVAILLKNALRLPLSLDQHGTVQ